MNLSRWLRNNPAVVLASLVTALGVWVVSDAAYRDRPPDGPTLVPAPATTSDADLLAAKPDPLVGRPVPVGVLPQLRPGMSRIEVEGLIGLPPADGVLPVAVVDGRATYQTAYPVDLDPSPVMTVRPFGRRIPLPPSDEPPPTSLIALEFDASVPGHPLVNVHFLDPLF
jgi:hypothetical protein